MVLLRSPIRYDTIERLVASTSTSAGAQSSLSVPAPFTFLSSAPAPHPHGADISDEMSFEKQL